MSKKAELEHKCEALDKELRKTSAMLGKSEKREKEKDEKIRTLRREKNALEKVYFRERKRRDELEREYEKAGIALREMGDLFEARFAYLISEFAGGEIDDTAMNEWLKRHEYLLKGEKNEKNVRIWRCIVREIGDEDRRLAGEILETGGKQDKEAEARILEERRG